MLRRRMLLLVALVAVAAVPAGSAPAAAADLGARGFALDGASLLAFDPATPAAATPTTIVGVTPTDTLVAIAVRPQNGELYALGVDTVADTAQLYHLSARTGFATAIGAAAAFVLADGTTPVQISGSEFGMAFNPTVDRLRVVSSDGLNFRLNPNTGAPVDGNGAGGTGINTDGPINGATTGVGATAYTNRRQVTAITTQYTLDAATDALHIQNPPNNGTQTAGLAITVNGVPVDLTAAEGLDLLPGVQAPASGAAATGVASAAMTVAGVTGLYTIDLTTGAATRVGPIGGGGAGVRGLAVQAEEVAGGVPAVALVSGGPSLARFNTGDPGAAVSQAVTGVTAGEALVGIDWRPQTGQLCGLGVNATANTATAYVIDPVTGAATAVGAAGSIAFVGAGGSPIDLPDPATSGYGLDFDPTVDRIRVVTGSGLNFRVNPGTGAPVDGNLNSGSPAGVNPDGPINGLAPGSTGVSAVAHTNSFGQPLTGGVTTAYALDAAADALTIQSPPNAGTQTAAVTVKLGAAPLDFTAVSGFDIRPAVAVGASNAPAAGTADAVIRVAGATALYRIDLATGAATSAGPIGGGLTADGLAVGDGPPPPTAPEPPAPGPGSVLIPGRPSATPAPAAEVAPVISRFSLSNTTFRTGPPKRATTRKVKRGSTFRLSLSKTAAVAFTIERRSAGRRQGGRCRPATSRNRRSPACTLFTRLVTLRTTLAAGRQSLNFAGIVRGEGLPPGRYRVTAVARDTGGRTSAPASATFTVVR